MKRKLFLSIALVLAAITTHAGPITYKQAAENVQKFLYGNTTKVFSNGPIKLASSAEGKQPYYVFNIGNNEGFVIASGDDAAYAILGYSSNGHLDMENMPDNMRAWLEGYERELIHLQGMNLTAPKSSVNEKKARRTIPALMTSEWAQGNPYNKFCPDFNDGYGARPTGCVATAIAQVMNFHQWPEGKTSSVSGYEFSDEDYTGGDETIKKVDPLEPTTFDWDAMLNVYDDESNTRSADAVANLMNYVGHSVKMVYGPYSSGAFATDIVPALVNVFGYQKSASLIERINYKSQEQWDDIVYNEIANNRPVVYYGQTNKFMGHQFVCDGYKDGFFHINWGWAGMSDGYFKLSVLKPENQGTGGAGNGESFSEYQKIVIGLEKPITQNRLYASSLMTTKESDIPTIVRFDNLSNNFVSATFDLTLPAGITLQADENGNLAAFDELRSEKGDHTVSVTKVSEGKYHFNITSPSRSHIMVSSGPLVRFSLKASAELTEEHYTASISNVVMSDDKQAETKLADSSFDLNFYTITKVETLLGDANKDGKVTTDDVKCVVDYIMYKFPSPFDFSLADANADGMIDVADVMSVLDIVLKAAGEERNFVPTEIDETDVMTCTRSQTAVNLNLANKTDYKAIQMDFIVPTGSKLTEVVPNETRMNGFEAVFTSISEGRYRMVIYSP